MRGIIVLKSTGKSIPGKKSPPEMDNQETGIIL